MTILASFCTVVALVGSTADMTVAFLPSRLAAKHPDIAVSRSRPQSIHRSKLADRSYRRLEAQNRPSASHADEMQAVVPVAPSTTITSTPARPGSSLPPRRQRRSSSNSHKKSKKDVDRQPSKSHQRYALNPRDLLSDLPYLDKHQFVDKLVERHLLDAAPPSSSSSSPGPAPPLSLTAQSSTSFMPALVLNADYQPLSFTPLSLWSWQEAVKAVFRGKVTVVDVYENVVVRGVSLEIPLPSVIALNEYVSNHKSIPAFTKRNVYLRDEYKCCYCNDQFFSQSDLSIDHVHPRCRGGRLDWENAVTSCRICNGRKGSLGVGELASVGMRLLRPPKVPSQYELSRIASRLWLPRRKVHPTWKPFLDQFVEP